MAMFFFRVGLNAPLAPGKCEKAEQRKGKLRKKRGKGKSKGESRRGKRRSKIRRKEREDAGVHYAFFVLNGH
ncbi:MAG: hypothetical protein FRX49_01572 [Trebouxia sp. A1-2]|nr:MAG: hypothetical protein FRX49_01572 [Trebouxia sp. A1-2]